MIEIWRAKKANEQATLELKIQTYADAIRYISICSRIAKKESVLSRTSNEESKALSVEEANLFNHFHPVFSIIAPKEKVYAYNDLRNKVLSGQFSQEESY